MRAKSSAKPAKKPADLGTKRVCPKCAAKFYDFGKTELECPKCNHEIDVTKLKAPAIPKAAPTKREVEPAETETVSEVESDFESVDDLESDDDNIVEKFEGDSDDQDDSY